MVTCICMQDTKMVDEIPKCNDAPFKKQYVPFVPNWYKITLIPQQDFLRRTSCDCPPMPNRSMACETFSLFSFYVAPFAPCYSFLRYINQSVNHLEFIASKLCPFPRLLAYLFDLKAFESINCCIMFTVEYTTQINLNCWKNKLYSILKLMWSDLQLYISTYTKRHWSRFHVTWHFFSRGTPPIDYRVGYSFWQIECLYSCM